MYVIDGPAYSIQLSTISWPTCTQHMGYWGGGGGGGGGDNMYVLTSSLYMYICWPSICACLSKGKKNYTLGFDKLHTCMTFVLVE